MWLTNFHNHIKQPARYQVYCKCFITLTRVARNAVLNWTGLYFSFLSRNKYRKCQICICVSPIYFFRLTHIFRVSNIFVETVWQLCFDWPARIYFIAHETAISRKSHNLSNWDSRITRQLVYKYTSSKFCIKNYILVKTWYMGLIYQTIPYM
jgi:hypothetical protein